MQNSYQMSNVNIYIEYYDINDTNKIQTIYEIKDGNLISDNYKKPFGWKATKYIEFDSNFDDLLYEYSCTTWKFLLFGGTDEDEKILNIKKGHNLVKLDLGIIGERDGQLVHKSTIPKLCSEMTYKNKFNEVIFRYKINYKIAKPNAV